MPFFDEASVTPKGGGQYFDIEDNTPKLLSAHTRGAVVPPDEPSFKEKAKKVGKRVLQEAGDVGEGVRGLAGMVTTLPISLAHYAGGLVDSVVQEDISKENIDRNVERRAKSTEGLTNFLSGGPVVSERGKAIQNAAGQALAAPGIVANDLVTKAGNAVINTEDYPNVVPNLAGAASVLADVAVPLDIIAGVKAARPKPIVERPLGIGENRTPSNFQLREEGKLVTPERPARTRQEPVLNDMPPVGPEVQRRNQIQEVFDRDGEVLANQIADRREQPVLFESPDFPRPDYQPLDPRVEAWREAEAQAGAEIADGIARQRSMPVPVGEGILDVPLRTNVPPRLNDMPQPQRLLPEPDRFTGRRADVEAAIAADEAAKLEAMANGRQQPNLFETRTQERPTYELEDSRIDNWKAGQEDLAAQIAEARKQPSGWANHDNLAGPTVVTAADSLQTSPKVKPVIKGTVEEVSALAKGGTLNPKDHQVFYPEGKTDPNAPAYVIRKQGIDRPIEAVKQELRMGGAAESRWLGYPDRTNVPSSERVTAAVTKDGQVVVDPARIMEESTNKNVAWAAEGEPSAVVEKANEVGASISEPIKSSPELNTNVVEPKIETTEPIGTTLSVEPYGKRFAVRLGEGDSSVLLGAEFKTKKAAQRFIDEQRAKNENIKDLHAGIHPKEVVRAADAALQGINKIVREGTSYKLKATVVEKFEPIQRIAASGKYPEVTNFYKDTYTKWGEDRTSIVNDLFSEVKSDIPEESFMGMKPLRELDNTITGDNRIALNDLFKRSDVEKRWFSREELEAQGYHPDVITVYHEGRKLQYRIGMEDLNQTLRTAIETYKEEPWYDTVREWIDEGLNADEVQKFADEYNVLVDKDAIDALSEVNKVQKWIEAEKEHMALNPEYFPRNRPDGGEKTSVYELNGDGSLGREIYMRPAVTEIGARNIAKALRKDPTRPDEYGFSYEYNRMKRELGRDPIEGEDYKIVTDQLKTTPDEDTWVYSGSMPAKQAVINNMLDGLAGKIDKETSQTLRKQLIKELTKEQLSRGAGRHKLQRQDHHIEGYDITDPIGVIMSNAQSMAGFHTKARYAIDAARAFKKANREEKIILNKFIQKTLKNERSDFVKAGAFSRQLLTLGNLAFRGVAPYVNMMQNPTWAGPELSALGRREGFKKPYGLKDITIAAKDIMKDAASNGKVLTDIERQGLDEFSRIGAAEAQNLREISGLNTGRVSSPSVANTLLKPVNATARGIGAATEFGMKPFGWVETYLNREADFLAAFRMYLKEGTPYKDAFEKAKVYSMEVNIDGSRHNYPGIVGNSEIGKTAYTFMRMPHSYMSWLFQKAVLHQEFRPVVRSLLTLAALGGTAALPFANEFDKFLERLHGKSPKLAIRNEIKKRTEEYGLDGSAQLIEDFVLNGAHGVAGINISRSLSPGLPVVSELMASGDVGKAFGGAVSGQFGKAARAYKYYSEGDTYRALENLPIVPAPFGNTLSSYRLYKEGATTGSNTPVNDTQGNRLKLTGPEAILRATTGANPQRYAREMDIRDSLMTMEKYYQGKANTLQRKLENNKFIWTPALRKEEKELKQAAAYYNVPIKINVKPKRKRRDRRMNRALSTYNYITEGDD